MSLTLLEFLNKCVVLFYSLFILLFGLFYTDQSVSIILFYYDYLNSTTILLCLCFYSLYYNFVNLNLFVLIIICTDAFRFVLHTTLTKKSDFFEICLSIISKDAILILLYHYIFKWCYVMILMLERKTEN